MSKYQILKKFDFSPGRLGNTSQPPTPYGIKVIITCFYGTVALFFLCNLEPFSAQVSILKLIFCAVRKSIQYQLPAWGR